MALTDEHFVRLRATHCFLFRGRPKRYILAGSKSANEQSNHMPKLNDEMHWRARGYDIAPKR